MKNKLKVGDIARKLNIKKNIIRFWEKEFGFRSKENKNAKYYTQEEFNTFTIIKKMVHDKGIPISEAKTKLQTILPAEKASPLKESTEKSSSLKEPLEKKLTDQASAETKQLPQAKVKAIPKPTNKAAIRTEMQRTSTETKPKKEILLKKSPKQKEEKVQTKEIKTIVEKVVEIEKPVPYVPQEFLNQLHLLKEQLIKFKNLLN